MNIKFLLSKKKKIPDIWFYLLVLYGEKTWHNLGFLYAQGRIQDVEQIFYLQEYKALFGLGKYLNSKWFVKQ